MAKRRMNNPKITILWNTVAIECQDNVKLLKNLSGLGTFMNGLFYAPGMCFFTFFLPSYRIHPPTTM
ncbi:hypothetical protein K435DRAFT_487914 [Dendrothele bispora CBS 962.96]|uniref:Uncharacterized protein n=1 Tax=Dendrothele bispora (strain CBS 962.96) TaxID=1314807 RepID=A0A4S8KYI4_DENBC|nr:hypothetical protein K435DRAFT_487914 [Dendrothele bispora CBS 962.96]